MALGEEVGPCPDVPREAQAAARRAGDRGRVSRTSTGELELARALPFEFGLNSQKLVIDRLDGSRVCSWIEPCACMLRRGFAERPAHVGIVDQQSQRCCDLGRARVVE